MSIPARLLFEHLTMVKTFFGHAFFKMKKTNNKAEARPFAYRLQQLNRVKRGVIFFLQALRRQIKSRIG